MATGAGKISDWLALRGAADAAEDGGSGVHVQLSTVVIDPRVRGLCRLPYQDHPQGCPNFNHKPGCPPHCPSFERRFDLATPTFAIVNEFDLAAHVEWMRASHPGWSERQLECCLYWQPRARKELAAAIARFRWGHPECVADTCPEAGAVNVTETLRAVGIELEWPPKRIVRQVAIAAIPLVSGKNMEAAG